jgi:hypothetical protein
MQSDLLTRSGVRNSIQISDFAIAPAQSMNNRKISQKSTLDQHQRGRNVASMKTALQNTATMEKCNECFFEQAYDRAAA